MSLIIRASKYATLGVALLWSASASAGSDPKGIWFDHNGRGAVEISDCENGRGLCGFVVHVKEARHAKRCGLQILGNVTSNGGGWIYSPSRGRKYTVRLKRLSDSRLRVVGNASSSFFSKTFTWKRAPDDIELCGKYAIAKRAKEEPKVVEKVVEDEAPVKADEPKKLSVRPTIEEQEEAELERNAVAPSAEETNDDAPDAYAADEPEADSEPASEYGSVSEDETGDDTASDGDNVAEAPIENDVSEVFDELISKASKYTGKLKRKCKFRIPYVDKVIMIPCGD